MRCRSWNHSDPLGPSPFPRVRPATEAAPTSWSSAAARPAPPRPTLRPICGAEVVLVERYGFLGGNATVALVMPLMSFHNEQKQAVFDERGGHGHAAAAHRPRRGRAGGGRIPMAPAGPAHRTRRLHPALPRHRLHGAVRSGALQTRPPRPARRGGCAHAVPLLRLRRAAPRRRLAGGLRDQVRAGRDRQPASSSTGRGTATSPPRAERRTRSAGRRTGWCSR